jgi:mRNA interferase MazF
METSLPVINCHRGEVWFIDLNPAQGREQSGRRPCLIVSDDRLNKSPAELVIVVPITSKDKRIPSHVEIVPPEGGLQVRSFIKCEDIRSISTDRLIKAMGMVNRATLDSVEERLRLLLTLMTAQ